MQAGNRELHSTVEVFWRKLVYKCVAYILVAYSELLAANYYG
jgi:hypothetical protein